MHDDPTRRMDVPPPREPRDGNQPPRSPGTMGRGVKALIVLLVASVIGLAVALAVVASDGDDGVPTTPTTTTPAASTTTTDQTTTDATTTQPTTTGSTATTTTQPPTTTTTQPTTSTTTEPDTTTTDGSGGIESP